MNSCSLAALFMSLLLATAAIAQNAPQPGKEDTNAQKLELTANSALDKGKVAVIQGIVDAEGLRFTVPSLSILQPVIVSVLAKSTDDELTVEVFKNDWERALRTASTRGSGLAQVEFRTEGGVNIGVRGAGPSTPFALLVWAGEELRPPLPDAIVTPAEFKAPKGADSGADGNSAGSSESSGSGGIGLLGIIVGAAVGALAVFVVLRLLGRRKES